MKSRTRVVAPLFVLTASLAFAVGLGTEPAFACGAPKNAPVPVHFDGTVIEGTGQRWRFQVEPRVSGLGDTVEVAISANDSDSSCATSSPPPEVGRRYHVVADSILAADGSGRTFLRVTNIGGWYSLIEPLPTVATKRPDAKKATDLAPTLRTPIRPRSERSLGAPVVAIAIIAGAAATLAMRRRGRRKREFQSGPVTPSAM
jgi:hypothetical protein